MFTLNLYCACVYLYCYRVQDVTNVLGEPLYWYHIYIASYALVQILYQKVFICLQFTSTLPYGVVQKGGTCFRTVLFGIRLTILKVKDLFRIKCVTR